MLKRSQVGLPARVGERAQRGSDRASSLFDRERAQRGSDRPSARPMTASCAAPQASRSTFSSGWGWRASAASERPCVARARLASERSEGATRPGTHADTDRLLCAAGFSVKDYSRACRADLPRCSARRSMTSPWNHGGDVERRLCVPFGGAPAGARLDRSPSRFPSRPALCARARPVLLLVFVCIDARRRGVRHVSTWRGRLPRNH